MHWTLRMLLVVAFGGTAPAFAASPPGVSSDLDRAATATPSEMTSFAGSAAQAAKDALTTLDKLLAQAQKSGDSDSVQCVNTKKVSTQALQQVIVGASTAMSAALTNGETESAQHEYRKIAIGDTKIRTLVAEAQQCVTGSNVDSGSTLVDWDSQLEGEEEDQEVEIDDTDIDIQPPQITPFS